MGRLRGSAAVCIASLALIASTRPAGAQVGELDAHGDGKALLALELGFFGDGDFLGDRDFSVFMMSPLLRFFYPIARNVMLSADWGFVFLSYDDHDDNRGDSDFRTGNLFVGAHYV
jgi:hypothetical protein